MGPARLWYRQGDPGALAEPIADAELETPETSTPRHHVWSTDEQAWCDCGVERWREQSA